jgi:hypothetical protein
LMAEEIRKVFLGRMECGRIFLFFRVEELQKIVFNDGWAMGGSVGKTVGMWKKM